MSINQTKEEADMLSELHGRARQDAEQALAAYEEAYERVEDAIRSLNVAHEAFRPKYRHLQAMRIVTGDIPNGMYIPDSIDRRMDLVARQPTARERPAYERE